MGNMVSRATELLSSEDWVARLAMAEVLEEVDVAVALRELMAEVKFSVSTQWRIGDLIRYALQWKSENIIAVSTLIQDWLTSSLALQLMKQGAMMTVLSTLLTALAWPTTLIAATDFIDSKWAIAIDRSDKVGKLLAEVLMKGLQGNMLVTLVGYSLGARVIFKCLQYLEEAEQTANIVQRVVLLGAPISIKDENWEAARKEWLDLHGPFDAIVDGTNVSLVNARSFNFFQLNAVVNQLREISPSKKTPLVILHKGRVLGGRAQHPRNKKLLDTMSGALYATPPGSGDDWLFLRELIMENLWQRQSFEHHMHSNVILIGLVHKRTG